MIKNWKNRRRKGRVEKEIVISPVIVHHPQNTSPPVCSPFFPVLKPCQSNRFILDDDNAKTIAWTNDYECDKGCMWGCGCGCVWIRVCVSLWAFKHFREPVCLCVCRSVCVCVHVCIYVLVLVLPMAVSWVCECFLGVHMGVC